MPSTSQRVYPAWATLTRPDALEELLAGGESDWVEFKQSWSENARKKGTEAVCAFAADLANHNRPGVLFVGVKDDGTPAGLTIDGQLLEQLTSIKIDSKILPPPTLLVEKRILKGVEVAVVTVWPADSPPVRYDGRICVRSGPRRGVATAQEERLLNEKRRFRDQPFDAQPCHGPTMADLDLSWYKGNTGKLAPGHLPLLRSLVETGFPDNGVVPFRHFPGFPKENYLPVPRIRGDGPIVV